MKYIRETYAQYAVRIHEIAKFGVVGGIGFLVQLGVTDGAHFGLGIGALTSIIIGYVVATVVTFLGNRHWAFKHRQGKGLHHETILFILLNCVGLGIQEAVVATVHYGLHMTDPLAYNAANIVGIALGTVFRLWSYRKWVFLEVNEEPAEVAPTVLPHEMPPPVARAGDAPAAAGPPVARANGSYPDGAYAAGGHPDGSYPDGAYAAGGHLDGAQLGSRRGSYGGGMHAGAPRVVPPDETRPPGRHRASEARPEPEPEAEGVYSQPSVS